jgi:hypothetical protein
MADIKDKNQADTSTDDFAEVVLPETLEDSRSASALDLPRLNRLLSSIKLTPSRSSSTITICVGKQNGWATNILSSIVVLHVAS